MYFPPFVNRIRPIDPVARAFYQIRLTLREVLLLSMTEKLAYIKKLRHLTTEEIARHSGCRWGR